MISSPALFKFDRAADRWRAFLTLIVLALCFPSFAAAQELRAHGSDDRIWLARIQPEQVKGAGDSTAIFMRQHSDPKWVRIDPIGSRIVGMGSRGSQLAILLANGDWRLTTESGLTSGRPLPVGMRLVAINSDSTTLWGLGVAQAKSGPATTSSTAPTATSSSTTRSPVMRAAPAATAPSQFAPGELVLYRLGGQGWEEQGSLPKGLTVQEFDDVALGVADGSPVVAHRTNARTIALYRRDASRNWQKTDDIQSPADVQEFHLLGGTADPVMWMRSQAGSARLWISGHGGEAPVVRDLKVPGNAQHAVTYGNGAIRLLWLDGEKIFDQRLQSDTGQPEGDPAPLPLPAISILPAVQFWAQLTLTTALVFALAASLRRRREMQEIELDPAKLNLAPFSTRLIAGVIDALPMLVAAGLARYRSDDSADLPILLTLAIGASVYIALTTLMEMAVGRSIGKLLTGLHVVGLDGKPAPLGSRVMRNVLRIIDLPIMPLALVVFSPLRQRAADLAAGTLVIKAKAAVNDAAEKPES